MASHGGARPGAGRKKGVPNKLTSDVKAMVLSALNDAGGAEYLLAQSASNPVAFMTLVGKVLPLTVAGDADNPLKTVQEIVLRGVRPDGNG
jgi:hypothetical protein